MANADIELTMHVGMGKTGTSAIQSALRQAPDALREHGLSYLGMWWSVVDPRLEGPPGMEAASRLDPPAMEALAERLVDHVRAVASRDGVSQFVFSNEALYAHTDAYQPLYAKLAEHLDLRFVVYVRDPRRWLASAYAQWGIMHRPPGTPVTSFARWAEDHIGIYAGLRWWQRHHADRLVVRRFEATDDVVADFSSVLGAELALPFERVYVTPERAVLLAEVLRGDPQAGASSLPDLIARHFDAGFVPDLLERWSETFDGIRDELGVDLRTNAPPPVEPPSVEEVRDRLVGLGVRLDRDDCDPGQSS